MPPTKYHQEDVLAKQAPKEHGALNIEDQVNDHIEEDDHMDKLEIMCNVPKICDNNMERPIVL